MHLPTILETTKAIAKEAGNLIKEGYESDKTITNKSSVIDLVTDYDQASERLIRQRLNAAYPDHRIVGEEQGADAVDSPHVWYVDPIDGTTNYVHGIPMFCVSIGMYSHGRPTIGVIYDPLRDEMFGAAAGLGATLTNSQGIEKKLAVTQTTQINQALLGTGFAYDRATSDQNNIAQVNNVLKECRGLRRLGSAALDLAYVAAGRLDGFWEFKLNMYDVGAGIVLVLEAGGQICTIPEGDTLHPTESVDILASGPQLKDILLPLLAG